MTIEGEPVRVWRWVHSGPIAVHVEVDAVIPKDDPTEPCLTAEVARHLDYLQQLADEGNMAKLAQFGEVFIRQAG